MGQVLLKENCPFLVRASNTTITLASSYLGQPTRINCGGQQYRLSGQLTLDTANTGLGGLDVGTLAADTLYYVYFCVNSSGTAGLVASLAAPTTGPAGFSGRFNFLGKFRTNSTPVIAMVVTDPGIAPQASTESLNITTSYNNSTGLVITEDLSFTKMGEYLLITGTIALAGTGTDAATFSVSLSLNGVALSWSESNIVGTMRKQGSPDTTEAVRMLGPSSLAFRVADGTTTGAASLPGTAFGNVTSGDFENIVFGGGMLKIDQWTGLHT